MKLRLLGVALAFVAGCGNGATNPSIDGGNQDFNVGMAVPIDGAKSMVAVDRSSGVKADGKDQAKITVTLVDTSGKPLPGIALVLAATGGDVILGQPPVTDGNGVATGTLASTRPGAKTVSVLANPGPFAVALQQTPSVTFSAGAAARLAFAMQPASVPAGGTEMVSVQVLDALGNPVPSATDKVSIAILSNPGKATLGGTAQVNAVNGVATFTDLKLDRVGQGYTLIASTPQLGVAISSAFDVLAGQPAQLGFLAQPQSGAQPGAALQPPVVVAVQDAAGNTIAGATDAITLSLGNNTTGGTLSGTLTRNAVNGVATFNDVSIDQKGAYTLIAQGGTLTQASSAPFTVGGGPVIAGAHLEFTTQPASSVAGQTIQVTVTVEDALGQAIPTATNPVTVSLFTNPGGGKLSGTSQVNAVNGVASFMVSVDKAASGYSLVATSTGITTGVSAGFDVIPGAPAQLAFSTQPPGVAAGAVLAPPVVVAVEDASGNVVPGATTPITVALGNNPGSATLGGTLTVNAQKGLATFNDLTVSANGSYTLTAAATGLTGATSTSFTIGGPQAGPASRLVFTTQPASTTAGAQVAVTVQVQDQAGNAVGSATNAITLSLFTNPGGGKLSGTSQVNAVNGVASFMVSVDKAASGYSLVATAAGLQPGISSAFDVAAGAATQLLFTSQPPNGSANTTLAPPVVVAIADANGNVVSAATNTITLALGNNATGATLGGTLQVNAVNGLATFNDLTVSANGSYTLTAAAGGLTGATSAAFTIGTITTIGPAARVAFTTQPVTSAAGAQIAVSAQIEDANGNLVSGATNPITLALFTNPGGGTLSGTTQVNAVNGAASFRVSVDKVGSGYKLVATASGLVLDVSQPFDINAAAASRLAFTSQPPSGPASQALAPPVVVAVQDAFGNAITNGSNAITVALTTPNGATLGGTTTVNAVNGVATFNDLTVNRNGSYTLTATAGGLMPATSGAFTIGSSSAVGPESKLAFSVQPSSIVAGSMVNVTVQVEDASGNLVASSTDRVTVALFTNPGGATLSGTRTVNAVNGTASFSLGVDRIGTGYALVATAQGLQPGLSAAFDVTPGTATQLRVTQQPPNGAPGATLQPPVVIAVEDAAGNPIPGATNAVTVAIANNTTGAVLSGTLTQNAVNGLATFNDLSVDRNGSYTLMATASGLTSSTTQVFSIAGGTTTGPGARLAFSTQPVNTAAGQAISVSVQVLDSNNTIVSGATNSISLGLFADPGGDTLGGTTQVNAVNGTASFTVSLRRAAPGYALVAASNGLTPAVSASFNVTAGAGNQLRFVGEPPFRVASGQVIMPAPVVEIDDAFGNPVSSSGTSIAVALGNNGSGATLSGTPTSTTMSGQASFAGLSVDRAQTDYVLTASSSGLTSASSTAFTVTAGAASALVFTTQPANGTAGQAIQVALAVQDSVGNAVTTPTTITLGFGANPGGAPWPGPPSVNTVNGVASFALTVGRAANGYTISATAGSLTATSSAFNVITGAAAQLAITTQPSSVATGQTITPPPSVQVLDAAGNLVAAATNTISVALTNNSTGATLAGTTSQAASAGAASFSSLSVNRAGSYTLTFSATGLGPVQSSFFAVGGGQVGAASKLVFSTQPTSAVAGASVPVTVQVQDANGNVVTGASSAITLTLFTNPGSGALSGTTTVAAVNGIASFTVSVNRVGQGYSLAAETPGLPVAVSAAFDISAGAASQLAFQAQPPSAGTGATLAPPVVVAVTDASGNVISGATNAITVALTTPGGATLSGTLTRAASNGLATFNDLKVNTAGTYTLTATASGLTQAVSSSFTVSSQQVGAASRLAFSVQPASTTAGANISVTVQVQDGSGNLISTANNAISVALFTNPGGATIGGTRTVNAVNGAASFTLSLDRVGQGYSFVATANGLQPGVSNAFDIAVGAASQLVFVTQPSAVPPGSTIAPAVQVAIEDASGNVVTSATGTIALTLGNNTTGATLTGGGAQSVSNGVASFPVLSVNLAGSYTLVASSTGFTNATSSSFSVGSGATGSAAKLVFTNQPGSTTAGSNINVTVQVQDGSGNLVTSASNTITLSFFTNPGSATLGGTRTVTASGGVASFTVSVNKPGTGYSLAATATGLSVGTSTAFDISIGPAAQLAFVTQPSGAQVGANLAPPVQVAVEDAAGNVITSATTVIAVALSNNTTGATLSGTLMQTASGGVATFPDLKIDRTGTYTLTATGGTLPSVVSSMFSIGSGPMTGAAAKLAFAMQPSSITAGGSVTVSVQVQDANNNPVSTATNAITISGSTPSGGFPLVGTTQVNAVNGVASFTVTINQAGNGVWLTATSPGLAVAESNAFNVDAGAASKLVYLQQPQNAAVGAVIAPAVQVAIEDSAGNILAGSSATVALTLNGGTGTLGGTTSVAASMGVATFNNLTVSAAGSYTLSAASGTLPAAASSAFSIGSGSSGSGNRLVFSTQPTSTQAGNNINVTVQVQDGNGNVVTSATNSITVSLFTNPGGDTLMGTRTVSAVNGAASFTLQLQRAASGYSFTATATGLNVGISVAFDILPGAASKLSFYRNPPFSVTVGQVITPAVQVAVTDQYNNFVPSASNMITLALGNNPSGATLSGTLTVAAMNGIASFSDLTLDKQGNNLTLVASATGFTNATSNPFQVNAGPATHLVVITQPTSTTAGAAISFVVAAEDMFGNINMQTNGQVTFTPSLGGTPQMARTSPMFQGQAGFNGVLSTAGTYTIAASFTGLTGVTSNSFTITPGPAAQLVFTQQPTDITIGGTIAPAVTVAIYDNYNNAITTATDTLSVALSCCGTATLGGTLSQPTAMGVSTFNNLSVSGGTGTFYLQARNAAGTFYSASKSFVVQAGAPTQLSFGYPGGRQPYNFTAGQTTTAAVAIEDVNGYVNTAATNQVSISITPTVTLTGTVTNVTPVNGVATFTFGTTTAGAYTITATATGLMSATSQQFVVNAGQPTALAFVQQPPSTGGKPYNPFSPPVAVARVDTYGNVNPYLGSNIVLSLASGTGVLLGATGVGNYTTGVWSFPTLELDRTGTFTLKATDTATTGALPSLNSSSFTISAAAWTQINSGLDGGSIAALAVNGSNVYAGTTGSGLFKSTDGGVTWTRSNSGLLSNNVTALAINPGTTSTILAGTDIGLFRSTDSGATWTQATLANISSYQPPRVTSIAFAPSANTTVYVGVANNPLQKSTDGGATWTAPATSYPSSSYASGVATIAVSPTTAATLFIGNGYNGLYQSTDGGATFTGGAAGLNSGSLTAVLYDPSDATHMRLYASGQYGVYQSTNAGGSWAALNTGLTYQNIHAMVIGPQGTLYAATDKSITTATYKLTSGGASWTSVSGFKAHNLSIAFDGAATTDATVYFGGDGPGVAKTTDSATTITPTTTGIGALDITKVLINPTTPATLFVSTAGRGVFTSTNSGTSWAQTTTQPANLTLTTMALAPSNPSYLYAAGNSNDVYFSSDGGATWKAATTPPSYQINALAVHPTTPMTAVAACAYYIYQTTDGGATWSTSTTSFSQLTSIAYDASNPANLYATSSYYYGGGFLEKIGAGTWQSYNIGLPNNGNSPAFAFGQNPGATGDFFVGIGNAVFRQPSINTPWAQSFSWGNPNPQVTPSAIAFDATQASVVYAASNAGVIRSANDGGAWAPASSGLFNGNVTTFAADPKTSNLVYLGTNGAGVWTSSTGGL